MTSDGSYVGTDDSPREVGEPPGNSYNDPDLLKSSVRDIF